MSSYDVVIKKVEPIRVASVRGVVPTPPEQGLLWQELEGYLAMHRVRLSDSPCLTLYYDEEYKERDWDLEVCIPIEEPLLASQRVRVYDLPAVETMACTVHAGPFVTINDAYTALMKWLDANGYRTVGPAREIYLRTARHDPQGGDVPVDQNDPETVTEIQFPVEKI